MAKKYSKYTDQQYLKLWEKFRDNIDKATPIDLSETPLERKNRVEELEKKPEEWFKYYFPNFYTSEPADFHKRSTRKVLNNPEYYLVRSWSRELAKSARTMMEVLYLVLTGKKSNVLLVSDSLSNATRLILPYKVNLESNNRIINDYGPQQAIGSWEASEFITKNGKSFRALGAGQSPRGTRNDAARPDVILLDDIDTDEDCRNPDIIRNKVEWIESALIPTRSISEALLIIACGNIIATYCCITEMAKKADDHEVVNIRNKYGKSTWPQKNTEEMIDRVLSTIGWTAKQREYYNNPIVEGVLFQDVTYQKAPQLRHCESVIVYADPSTSNKDKPKGKSANSRSYKAVMVIGYYQFQFFTYWLRLQQVGNATFINWLYHAHEFCKQKGVDPINIYIENNSLQDPHFEQVIKPAIKTKAIDDCIPMIYVRKDERKKPDKFERIDGTLHPIDEAGNLLFDKKLEGTPDMDTMESQMKSVSPNAKIIDGPDCLEGGVWLLKNKKTSGSSSSSGNTDHAIGKRTNNKY